LTRSSPGMVDAKPVKVLTESSGAMYPLVPIDRYPGYERG
jgi:hypothetical protein